MFVNHKHKIQGSFNQWLVGWGVAAVRYIGTISDEYCPVTSSTNLLGFTFLHHTHTDYLLSMNCLLIGTALNVYA